MKYIFNVAWYENIGQKALNLNPLDYEPEPWGGWKHWTLKQHLVYINEMISRKEEFTLVGDIKELEEQAKNAGDGETRCRIGAVVLLLYETGYTVYKADTDEPHHVLQFVMENEYDIPYDFEFEAISLLSNPKLAVEFWKREERKQVYSYILNVIAKTGR